jgi:predicted RNA-binding protein with PUA-like domain
MLEKDIENLIAQHPDDFFPNGNFKLQGQQVKLGSCYADILFTDKYERKIIIEVKRGILSRDAAGQVIEYYGLLKQKQPDAIIELIVCANTIPHERKLFLENVGIECKELGLSLIQQVANKYNYKFIDDLKQQDNKTQPVISQKINTQDFQIDDSLVNVWVFQANPTRYDVFNALSDPEVQRHHWQVNQNINKIKKGDIALIWMSGKEAGIYAVAEIASDPSIMGDTPAEEKYWLSNEDKGVERLRVELINKTVLINRPVYRYELKAIEELKNLSILRVAQGTNFPVSPIEWYVIKELIDNKIKSRN